MDGQEYLNQISASVRPVKQKADGLMGSGIFKLAIGGVIGFILLAIIGGMLGGGDAINTRNLSFKYRLDNILGVISSYQPIVKSSLLRSDSATLYSVLSKTNRDFSDYIVAKDKIKLNDKKFAKIADEAREEGDEIKNDLFEAKINGILDRVYANKMTYIVSLVMSKEADLINKSSDADLKAILATSYNSLENLYDKFNDFSKVK